MPATPDSSAMAAFSGNGHDYTFKIYMQQADQVQIAEDADGNTYEIRKLSQRGGDEKRKLLK